MKRPYITENELEIFSITHLRGGAEYATRICANFFWVLQKLDVLAYPGINTSYFDWKKPLMVKG